MTGRTLVGLTALEVGLALGLGLAACGSDEQDPVLPLADDTATTSTAASGPPQREEVAAVAADWAAVFAAGHQDACDYMRTDCELYVVGEPSDFVGSFAFADVEAVEITRKAGGHTTAIVSFSKGQHVEFQRDDQGTWLVSDVTVGEPGAAGE